MKLNLVWLLLLSLILTACSPGTMPTEKSVTTQAPSAIADGYPTFEQSLTGSDIGYPSSQSNVLETIYPDVIVVPTPNEGTAVVIGRLVTEANPAEAYLAPELTLSKLLQSNESDIPPLVRINAGSDPVAIQDLLGNFYFSAVPPGDYALVIASPMANIVLTNPDTGEVYTTSVAPGETYDLGEIVVQ